jgi:hypothetical protein
MATAVMRRLAWVPASAGMTVLEKLAGSRHCSHFAVDQRQR